MKKIILLIIMISILTSCGIEKKINTSNKDKKETINTFKKDINELQNLIDKQKFDEAIPELERIYNSNPNDISNTLNYMSALLAKGSITRQEKEYSKRAIEIGNKALKKFSNNSELHRNIGYAYEIVEDYKNAFKYYDKSIELDKKNALAYSNRGHAYRLYGDYMNAEKDFQNAYKINPNSDFVLINLAWIYGTRLRDDKLAIEYYRKAIENSNNIRFKSEAYHSIGQIYKLKGKYDEALKNFELSIKEDPKFELGYLGISEIKMMQLIYRSKDKTEDEKLKLLNEALAFNEKAIELNPTRAISFMNKGLILKDLKGYKDEGNTILKIALKLIPIDLTLGKNEKKSLKSYILKQIKNEK